MCMHVYEHSSHVAGLIDCILCIFHVHVPPLKKITECIHKRANTEGKQTKKMQWIVESKNVFSGWDQYRFMGDNQWVQLSERIVNKLSGGLTTDICVLRTDLEYCLLLQEHYRQLLFSGFVIVQTWSETQATSSLVSSTSTRDLNTGSNLLVWLIYYGLFAQKLCYQANLPFYTCLFSSRSSFKKARVMYLLVLVLTVFLFQVLSPRGESPIIPFNLKEAQGLKRYY